MPGFSGPEQWVSRGLGLQTERLGCADQGSQGDSQTGHSPMHRRDLDCTGCEGACKGLGNCAGATHSPPISEVGGSATPKPAHGSLPLRSRPEPLLPVISGTGLTQCPGCHQQEILLLLPSGCGAQLLRSSLERLGHVLSFLSSWLQFPSVTSEIVFSSWLPPRLLLSSNDNPSLLINLKWEGQPLLPALSSARCTRKPALTWAYDLAIASAYSLRFPHRPYSSLSCPKFQFSDVQIS